MSMNRALLAILSATMAAGAYGADAPKVIQHVTVYSKAGRYGGWPANHGMDAASSMRVKIHSSRAPSSATL